ncbi:MAG: PEGA domain-containing protein [Nitrospira sp.]|nr:PEGA domain-containing protein [Nitrospira sp.]
MKTHDRLFGILMLVPLMLAFGCATIVVGDKQSLTFDSEPAGAQIFINGVSMGLTPATITIQKRNYENATVVFKKGGHIDQQATLHTKTTPGVGVAWPVASASTTRWMRACRFSTPKSNGSRQSSTQPRTGPRPLCCS